jgi:hypothetical protein
LTTETVEAAEATVRTRLFRVSVSALSDGTVISQLLRSRPVRE